MLCLAVMMKESKLTNFQQRHITDTMKRKRLTTEASGQRNSGSHVNAFSMLRSRGPHFKHTHTQTKLNSISDPCSWGIDLAGSWSLLLHKTWVPAHEPLLQSSSSQPSQQGTSLFETSCPVRQSERCQVCNLSHPLTHMTYELSRLEACVCLMHSFIHS